MLKLLHFADVHLGIENYGRLDSASGLSTRLLDFLSTFDQVVDHAISENIDLVIFAGDAYKTRDPSPTIQREFAKRIKRLSDAGLPVFLLVGNHDVPNAASRASSVEIFDILDVHRVHVAKAPGLHIVETAKGPVQVVALPWVMRSTFFTRDEMKNLSLEQLNEAILDKVTQFVDRSAAALDIGIPAILAAHATVFGADFGSEKSVMLGSDIVVPRSVLANRAFDYVALGHIHKHQELGEYPLVAYSGSLERIDFGEEKEEKGFMVVELDETQKDPGRVAGHQFVPVLARRFLTLQVNVGIDEDPTEAVLRAIERRRGDIDQSVIKLVVKLEAEAANRLRDDEVRRALKDAYFVAAVIKDVERSARLRLGMKLAEEMDPRQALAKYLEIKSVAPARVETLMDYAGRLMAKVEE